jgi:hypothetical protein
MGTRSVFDFFVAPYPGQEGDEAQAYIYRHWDGSPESVVPRLLKYWRDAIDRLAADPFPNPRVPQVSAGQVIMGLMLADIMQQNRLIDQAPQDVEYTYRFRQDGADPRSLALKIEHTLKGGKELFHGGYDALQKWQNEQES